MQLGVYFLLHVQNNCFPIDLCACSTVTTAVFDPEVREKAFRPKKTKPATIEIRLNRYLAFNISKESKAYENL